MPGTMSVPTAYKPSLSITVFGAAGAGAAPGDGDADGVAGAGDAAGDGDATGPGAGPCVSSGSALATTAAAAHPVISRPATAIRVAVGIPPIEIEGTESGT
ncbi:hypothetical protein MSIM_50620 [Mycobacterium simiae]|nr:hypothetical protein MSIM_50620 [Mycobacterium simiae]